MSIALKIAQLIATTEDLTIRGAAVTKQSSAEFARDFAAELKLQRALKAQARSGIKWLEVKPSVSSLDFTK